jgi:hypothetical protein
MQGYSKESKFPSISVHYNRKVEQSYSKGSMGPSITVDYND